MNSISSFISGCLLLLGLCSNSLAMGPGYLTDAELVKYPVIFIAQWEKAPFVAHRDPNDASVARIEAYTRLRVLEVIRGDVKPGEVELKIGWGISWNKEGKEVYSGTTTYLPGDVENVTAPAIWFCQRERSWDETRKDEYLTVRHYREVQPIGLRVFYETLMRPDGDKAILELLSMEHTDQSRRVLKHLSGGVFPWPYEPDSFYNKPKKRGLVLHDAADRVWKFIEENPGKPRPYSVAVYAELRGKDCVGQVRTLLTDDDPLVRGVAVGILAKNRDSESAVKLAAEVVDLKESWLACQIIKELGTWDDDSAVAALFGFLRNDSFSYQSGNEFGIPALLAKKMLLERTGHEFPFDIEVSQKAWSEARKATTKEERRKVLTELAPNGACPIRAVAFGYPSQTLREELNQRISKLHSNELAIDVRITNVSSKAVAILKYPSMVSEQSSFSNNAYGGGYFTTDQKREYITLEPNASQVIQARISTNTLSEVRSKGELTFDYLNNGSNQGVQAWIGQVKVDFGKEFRY